MAGQIPEGLHQHPWKLAEMGPSGTSRSIPLEFTITLEFFEGESRIGGKGVCNTYSAIYLLEGRHLHFQQIMTTRVFCPEPGARALESEYFAALEHVESYELQADQLTFFYDQGKNILLFRDPASTTPQEATGRSRNLSFDEAFADAIRKLPPGTPSHPDALDVVTVIEIRGEFGGFAGLRDLVVKVRRTSF